MVDKKWRRRKTISAYRRPVKQQKKEMISAVELHVSSQLIDWRAAAAARRQSSDAEERGVPRHWRASRNVICGEERYVLHVNLHRCQHVIITHAADAPERSELRRMTWHFLKIVCFCFGFLLPSFIFLFADITGLNQSITMSDMTFCCSAVSALRATYKKCWSDKTKVTAYLENNRRWKSNITNIYSYLDIWRSPWGRTVLCYFVKIRGDNILLLKRI